MIIILLNTHSLMEFVGEKVYKCTLGIWTHLNSYALWVHIFYGFLKVIKYVSNQIMRLKVELSSQVDIKGDFSRVLLATMHNGFNSSKWYKKGEKLSCFVYYQMLWCHLRKSNFSKPQRLYWVPPLKYNSQM